MTDVVVNAGSTSLKFEGYATDAVGSLPCSAATRMPSVLGSGRLFQQFLDLGVELCVRHCANDPHALDLAVLNMP